MAHRETQLPPSDWAREPMRSLDAAAFFAATCGAFLFIVLLATKGVAFLESDAFPPLLAMSEVLGVGVLVAGLLYVFRRARPALTLFFSPASILLGFAAWSYAFMLCERIGGPAAVVVGFSLGTIAMLPIGLAVALMAPDLHAALILSILTLATVVARVLSDRAERYVHRD